MQLGKGMRDAFHLPLFHSPLFPSSSTERQCSAFAQADEARPSPCFGDTNIRNTSGKNNSACRVSNATNSYCTIGWSWNTLRKNDLKIQFSIPGNTFLSRNEIKPKRKETRGEKEEAVAYGSM